MEQIYYGIAVVVYSIFIVRFILSWIGGDFDLDPDLDLDLGDLVSFKGLTHFLMGVSGWLSVKGMMTHHIVWYDYLIAFAIGLVFVIILYLIYRFMSTLEVKPQPLVGKQLIGKTASIYLIIDVDDEYKKYIITVDNNLGTVELSAKSKNTYSIGDKVTISGYETAYYLV